METLQHECGIAMVRLLKPLSYYEEHYGSWRYGLNKLYLLMEKQHNRGQDGAGIACINTDSQAGEEYLFRERAEGSGAITEIFDEAAKHIRQAHDVGAPLNQTPFAGNLYMGHLRYSTTGKHGLQYIHPFMRRDCYRVKSVAMCGNFNLTNSREIFNLIASKGQYPRSSADTHILLEQVGHRLDREVDRLYQEGKAAGLRGLDLTYYIEDKINLCNVFRRCAPLWDGGFAICTMTGSGEMLALRDPWGIRPMFYYADDEMVVVASERPVIQTALNVVAEDVVELQPGQALAVSKAGLHRVEQVLPAQHPSKCSFERIYFSRGSDKDIYLERKRLGYNLVPDIIKACDGDLKHAVISFIPNTAEVAYYGMLHGFDDYLNKQKAKAIAQLAAEKKLSSNDIEQILDTRIRSEKVAIKDIKLRTFIAEGNLRNDMSTHVYDVTYGTLEPGVDNLVVIDDSIVRGTTLKNSIVKILSRLKPHKIIFVSSSPQVRYPDFYGIDMSNMHDFIAFKAAVALLEERGLTHIIDQTYRQCKTAQTLPKEQCRENYVKAIYAPFSDKELSTKISALVSDSDSAPVTCIFQSLEGLHQACPNHTGDWYFSGDYPTPGGMKMLYQTFVDYYENHRK